MSDACRHLGCSVPTGYPSSVHHANSPEQYTKIQRHSHKNMYSTHLCVTFPRLGKHPRWGSYSGGCEVTALPPDSVACFSYSYPSEQTIHLSMPQRQDSKLPSCIYPIRGKIPFKNPLWFHLLPLETPYLTVLKNKSSAHR